MSAAYPRRVHGIDFSGALDAGKKIWITSGVIEGGALHINDCHRADVLPNSGRDRDTCLSALGDFIRKERRSAFGLDFPFGLPKHLVKERSWEDFVRSFGRLYSSHERFKEACLKAGGNRELKRSTDIESQTPFSPYNLRLYRQTYFGIRNVLCPLVRGDLACVLPMQRPVAGKPWILEVCPASTLKRENLDRRYKGKTEKHYAARACILDGIERLGSLCFREQAVCSAVLGDPHGDALDSIIAAFATFRALRNINRRSDAYAGAATLTR